MAMPSTPSGAGSGSATLENLDALECGVCLSQIRPPIFQCVVGHVLCSACRDSLASAETCHVCRVPIPGGYRRNHDMEKLLESIRVPCPNAAFGCTVKPVYYDCQVHLKECLQAPCPCPAPACSFVGSTAGLTDHFSAVHQWPCSEVQASEMEECILLEGFNVLAVIDGDRKHLLLLLVSREHAGRAAALIFVCPPARLATDVAFCYLQADLLRFGSDSDEDSEWHRQQSVFKLTPTDLSNGLPNPDGCFHLIVPKFALPDEEETISISAKIRIESVVDLSSITL